MTHETRAAVLERRSRGRARPGGGRAPCPDDPVAYAADWLGVALTDTQAAVARALLEPPYKVLVNSGHNVGKTFLAAVLCNWWYDRYDPGVVITTAPTERDVIDLLWTEVRLQRQRARLPLALDFVGPRAPEMRSGEEHWAKGYTARKGESFQGRHREHMLFVFDECEGVDAAYWTTAKTMFRPEAGNAWLCIGNPTTTTSQGAVEQQQVDARGDPAWRQFSLSALEHPNVAAALAGGPPPVPGAVTLAQLWQWVQDWCEPVAAAEAAEGDFEFPPGSGRWWRPGPVAEPRILGRRPSAGTYGVWSEALWQRAERMAPEVPPHAVPEIGADIARKGDDWSCYHVRRGPASVHHESHNGRDTVQNAGALAALARAWAARASADRPRGAPPVRAAEVPIRVDDDGVGGGVVDILRADGYCVVPVGAGTTALDPAGYPNRRSELWFVTADAARRGGVSVARLPAAVRARLRQQALAPSWALDAKGRRVVEPKEKTKQKLGRSPDDLDALNLAYAGGGVTTYPQALPAAPRRPLGPGRTSAAQRRGLFGR